RGDRGLGEGRPAGAAAGGAGPRPRGQARGRGGAAEDRAAEEELSRPRSLGVCAGQDHGRAYAEASAVARGRPGSLPGRPAAYPDGRFILLALLTQRQARSVRDTALKVRAPAAIPFENARRRVGPTRAGELGFGA